MRVSEHAIARYRERVAPVSEKQAREVLGGEFIRKACEFGADTIVLRNGSIVVIEGDCVVTVLPKGSRPMPPKRARKRRRKARAA